MARFGSLTAQEIADARGMYLDTIPYDRVRISDIGSGGAVTLAGRGLTDSTFPYAICWGSRVYEVGVRGAGVLATLIHELAHVWRGENRLRDVIEGVGRSRSATLNAVERLQRRNALKPDRDLGGPNSETRRRLPLPAQQLVAAQ